MRDVDISEFYAQNAEIFIIINVILICECVHFKNVYF